MDNNTFIQRILNIIQFAKLMGIESAIYILSTLSSPENHKSLNILKSYCSDKIDRKNETLSTITLDIYGYLNIYNYRNMLKCLYRERVLDPKILNHIAMTLKAFEGKIDLLINIIQYIQTLNINGCLYALYSKNSIIAIRHGTPITPLDIQLSSEEENSCIKMWEFLRDQGILRPNALNHLANIITDDTNLQNNIIGKLADQNVILNIYKETPESDEQVLKRTINLTQILSFNNESSNADIADIYYINQIIKEEPRIYAVFENQKYANMSLYNYISENNLLNDESYKILKDRYHEEEKQEKKKETLRKLAKKLEESKRLLEERKRLTELRKKLNEVENNYKISLALEYLEKYNMINPIEILNFINSSQFIEFKVNHSLSLKKQAFYIAKHKLNQDNHEEYINNIYYIIYILRFLEVHNLLSKEYLSEIIKNLSDRSSQKLADENQSEFRLISNTPIKSKDRFALTNSIMHKSISLVTLAGKLSFHIPLNQAINQQLIDKNCLLMLLNRSEEKFLEDIMSRSSKARISKNTADSPPNYHGITIDTMINKKYIDIKCLIQYIDNFKKIYYLNTESVNKNLDRLPTDYLNLRQSINYFYRKPQEPATDDETFCINSWNSLSSFKKHYIKHGPEIDEVKSPLEYTQMAINLLQNTDKWCCFCVLYDNKKHCYILNVIDENFYLGVYYLSPPRIGRVITFFKLAHSRINKNGYFKGNKYTVLKPNVLENYKQIPPSKNETNTETENIPKLRSIDESEESSLETSISDNTSDQMQLQPKQEIENTINNIQKVIPANILEKSVANTPTSDKSLTEQPRIQLGQATTDNVLKSDIQKVIKATNSPKKLETTWSFTSPSQSTLSQISQPVFAISSSDNQKTKDIQKIDQLLTK